MEERFNNLLNVEKQVELENELNALVKDIKELDRLRSSLEISD